jgi:hypothetical protein
LSVHVYAHARLEFDAPGVADDEDGATAADDGGGTDVEPKNAEEPGGGGGYTTTLDTACRPSTAGWSSGSVEDMAAATAAGVVGVPGNVGVGAYVRRELAGDDGLGSRDAVSVSGSGRPAVPCWWCECVELVELGATPIATEPGASEAEQDTGAEPAGLSAIDARFANPRLSLDAVVVIVVVEEESDWRGEPGTLSSAGSFFLNTPKSFFALLLVLVLVEDCCVCVGVVGVAGSSPNVREARLAWRAAALPGAENNDDVTPPDAVRGRAAEEAEAVAAFGAEP